MLNGHANNRPLQGAILILGPTGSGKTPLGEYLEQFGWNKRSCRHFDFGARLRKIDAGELRIRELGASDRKVIRRLLHDGALLEDHQFHIAAAILRDFMRRCVRPDQMVVLNGLPRHKGQAAEIARMLRIELVIVLNCAPSVVVARISGNAGGDRTRRSDDSRDQIARKLQWFRKRTKLLSQYYREIGVLIHEVRVTAIMGPEGMIP
jgi:adenylate kinase family enzyme